MSDDNTSANPAELDWAAAAYKRRQDHNIIQLMWPTLEKLPLDHEVRVLCLPAATWEFEQVLAKMYTNRKFVFVGVESDPEVHRQMAENAQLLQRLIPNARFVTAEHPCTTKQLFAGWAAQEQGQLVAVFDLVYLDYLGTWAKPKVQDVEFLFNRVQLSGLVLTCNLKRGRAKTNEKLKYQQHILPFLQDDYVNLVRLDAPHCTLEPGMCTYDKIGGIPSEIIRMGLDAGKEVVLNGLHVYDSLSKGRHRMSHSPEISLGFNIEEGEW